LEFGHEVDLFIEHGNIEGIASTIYKYEDGKLIILRS
jgi:tRNA A37 threonylcarbamoyladenosine synthetase subunit TsaC/SUA5/YrdC